MKTAAKSAHTKVRELEPFNKRKIDPSKFKSDLSPNDWREGITHVGGAANLVAYSFPIETLSAVKTVGRGRTNLTLIRPTIVQTDATTPYIGFDIRVSPDRRPGVQMHFEPAAYGLTSAATYVFVFAVEVSGSANFTLSGYAGSGTVTNAGPRTLSGRTTVSLVMKNVAPSAQVYAYLEQTSGGIWNGFSVRVQYPPLVLTM